MSQADRLLQLRNKFELTPDEMAEALRVAPAELAAMECGEQQIAVAIAGRAASVFCISDAWLLAGAESMFPKPGLGKPVTQLQRARRNLGVPPERMATLIGVDASEYLAYETGKRRLPPQVVSKARERIGLNPAFLQTGKGEMFLDGEGSLIPDDGLSPPSFGLEPETKSSGAVADLIDIFRGLDSETQYAAIVLLRAMTTSKRGG